MSSARFLNLPARSGYAVRSKYNGAGPGAPAAPGSGGCCRPRRAHPSSSLRCHSAGVVARAADPGDGEAVTAASTGGGADGRTLGIDRGIFGLPSQRRSEIEGFVRLLESLNPTPAPTGRLDQVDGCWKLLYSTITILGTKRTKLGLRDFISLGDFFQRIDVAQAINEISFSARGFKTLSGQLTIVASFDIASETRVNIRFEQSDIVPAQLMNLFQKNYDLLLAIFNPEGWLEITYLDESIRIGRDDKGNVFILERATDEKASQSPEPFTFLGSR